MAFLSAADLVIVKATCHPERERGIWGPGGAQLVHGGHHPGRTNDAGDPSPRCAPPALRRLRMTHARAPQMAKLHISRWWSEATPPVTSASTGTPPSPSALLRRSPAARRSVCCRRRGAARPTARGARSRSCPRVSASSFAALLTRAERWPHRPSSSAQRLARSAASESSHRHRAP